MYGARVLVTADAFQCDAEECRATALGEHPRAQLPGRVVPDVLPVATGEVRYPVPLAVLMEPFDDLLHRRLVSRAVRGRGGGAG